jgi:hypothetical protein
VPILASQTFAGQSVIQQKLAAPVFYKISDYIQSSTIDEFQINPSDLKQLKGLHRYDHVK